MAPTVQTDQILDLHLIRQSVGLMPDPAEVGARQVGLSTRRLLRAFQQRRGLHPPDGSLTNRATIDALRAELAEQGLLRSISGTITAADGTPARGIVVAAFLIELGGRIEIGRALTNDQGLYYVIYGGKEDSPAF